MSDDRVDNPFFARVWKFFSAHEPEVQRELRRENLAGLSGRVLEVGAGTGSNFVHYPTTVDEVVAVEPEPRLNVIARQTAATAPVPVTVLDHAVEQVEPGTQFDAVVCSLVLCSVSDQEAVLRQLFSQLRPGGQLRYFEHVASAGIRGRFQRLLDATVWPRLLGNCHTHRDTETAIDNAGFARESGRHEWTFPAWLPMPVSEHAIGRAVRPA
ncbi:MAG TPA: class I SAM-dependent methyltransferase [Mycobacterium sp.]|jgi:SAM-dependent methyltransferase